MDFSEEEFKSIVNKYTPMVVMWVERYKFMCPNHLYDDMVQEGIIGIWKAVKTFDPDRYKKEKVSASFSTWVWWKTRGAVEGFARRSKTSALATFEDVENHSSHESEEYSIKEDLTGFPSWEELIIKGCGSPDTMRAKIVRERFGMTGNPPISSNELARKHGISKQAVTSHVYRFFNTIRVYHPELKETLNPIN